MPKFKEFLTIENKNLKESKKVLTVFDKRFFFFIDDLGNLIQLIADEFGDKCNSDKYNKEISLWAKTNNIPIVEAFDLLKDANIKKNRKSKKDDTVTAKIALENIYSLNSRAHLLLRLQRDYFLGLSELIKLRYTTAFSFYRLQTESISLIRIFSDHPHIAQQWMRATSQEAGHLFYKKHHTKILKKIESFNLIKYYDIASSLSMHSRIMGIASGMTIGGKKTLKKNERSAALAYNEIDSFGKLIEFILSYLKFHIIIIKLLPEMLPEIDNNFIQDKTLKIDNELNVLIKKSYKLNHL